MEFVLDPERYKNSTEFSASGQAWCIYLFDGIFDRTWRGDKEEIHEAFLHARAGALWVRIFEEGNNPA